MRGAALILALMLTPAAAQTPAPGKDTAATIDAAPHCGGDTPAPKVPTLLRGYGDGGFPIRTADPRAQAFFDNGMQLAHAFAHTAAVAAFQESTRIDPACAMCLWGEAWAAGPTINYPVDAATTARLGALAVRAERLATDGPDRERALIAALRLRYGPGGDRAFARAMDRLAIRWPADKEIAVLAADAWMIPAAHAGDGAHLDRAEALLAGVLARDPDYTPAIHFYIHVTEMRGHAGLAEPYADRLAALAPAASHLVHMPSHTWYHVGRYHDAAEANVRAVAIGIANARRLGLSEPDGAWQLPYHAHNVQYGVGAALLSGDARDALALSDPLVARVGAGKTATDAYAQMVAGTAYFAEGRFADPARVMALPAPAAAFARAYWHYARGEAAARNGDGARVRAEAAAIPDAVPAARADEDAKAATRVMRIARAVLEGRAAMLRGDPAAALARFRTAAALQEAKSFRAWADPPAFWYPVRRDAAAALLALGRAEAARREADAALAIAPRDPATLAIRAEAEQRLGRAASAAIDRRRARAAWHGAAPLPGDDAETRMAAR